MTRPALVRQADVRRAVAAAVKAGFAIGTFAVEVEAGKVRILPTTANASSDPAAEAEERMRRAFGE